VHPTQRAPPGLIEGVQTPEMITRHFRNTLYYIQGKKNAAAAATGGGGGGVGVGEGGGAAMGRYDEVDVVGALLKMGIGR